MGNQGHGDDSPSRKAAAAHPSWLCGRVVLRLPQCVGIVDKVKGSEQIAAVALSHASALVPVSERPALSGNCFAMPSVSMSANRFAARDVRHDSPAEALK